MSSIAARISRFLHLVVPNLIRRNRLFVEELFQSQPAQEAVLGAAGSPLFPKHSHFVVGNCISPVGAAG